jgi:hypothetical protein
MRCERGAELLGDLLVATVGAVRIGIRHAHELLEVRFAAHADVFVDRHQENPTKAILAADPDGARGLMWNRVPLGMAQT